LQTKKRKKAENKTRVEFDLERAVNDRLFTGAKNLGDKLTKLINNWQHRKEIKRKKKTG